MCLVTARLFSSSVAPTVCCGLPMPTFDLLPFLQLLFMIYFIISMRLFLNVVLILIAAIKDMFHGRRLQLVYLN